MDLNLQNKQWKEFRIGNIFEVSKGIYLPNSKIKPGKIPYITAKSMNNGVAAFIEIAPLFVGNSITIGKVDLSAYYQPTSFYCSHDVSVITNAHLNKYTGQYICKMINRQGFKYSYGRQAQLNVVTSEKVFLPTNPQGNPDYAFMEAYMRQKEQEKLEKYKDFVKRRLPELQDYKSVGELDTREWREFYIGKLFSLSLGKSKGLNHLRKTNDGINYLGATNLNNGVLTQVMQTKELVHKGNAIAFIRNGEGSMGYSIYKAEDFIATSDISVGYSNFLNRHTGLFITTIADKVRGKYNFGYKRSDRRLKKEKIMLPVNQLGDPDYEYMENYMKRLEYQKLSTYLSLK